MDKRVVVIESNESLGQFLEQSIETAVGSEGQEVSVKEVDPNTIAEL